MSWCLRLVRGYGEAAICACAVTIFLAVWLLQSKKTKQKRLPPGPIAWPVVGNLFQVGANAFETFNDWRKVYGDVFSFKIGQRTVVIVSGQSAVSECLNAQSVLFSARPEFITSRYVLRGKSLTFANLDVSSHKQYRHLAMCALRDVTRPQPGRDNDAAAAGGAIGTPNGRPHVDKLLLEEGKNLGERLVEISRLSKQGANELTTAVQREILATVCVINASVLFGKRYDRSDAQVEEMVQVFEGLRAENSVVLVNFMPWLQGAFKHVIRRFVHLNQRIEKIITDHVEARQRQAQTCNGNSHTPSHHNESVLDCILQEVENSNESCYDRDRAMLLLGDLLGAGNDTICAAITWLIMYAATFQEVQDKVRQEIKDFEQEFNRCPTYADRDMMPYLMSYISEVLRHSSFVPLTIPHAPHHDATLGGFHIPQGTVVMANLWSTNRDPLLWQDSDEFRPERFLKSDGSFHRVLADKVNIFGGGRRRCAGEQLARVEMFLIVVSLFKHCRFARLRGRTRLPDTKVTLAIHPKTIDITCTPLG